MFLSNYKIKIKKKIINVFNEKGLIGVFVAGLNFILTRLFGLRVVKSNSVTGSIVARKVFSKCKLEYSEDGYYFLNPMPSNDELNLYYSSIYWDSRAGKNYGINTRDIVHYLILNNFIPQNLKKGNVFLNFGAGHGGISNFFWLKGMEIINIDPSPLPKFYNQRWQSFEEISQVPENSVDVIYGSHSLEHIQDINIFKDEVSRILKPNGFVFWEVPNPNCKINGVKQSGVVIPHTYYYEEKFFLKWFSKILICSGYEQSQRHDVIEDWQKYKDDKGSVIRVLGQIG